MKLNNQATFDNYLLLLKSTVEVYVHGTLESSNEKIRKLLNEGLQETLNNQAKTYEEMVKNGWYKVQNVQKSKIDKIYQEINK